MFGPVPEEFYGLLGRVVMVTSLLELWLLDLATTLHEVPQDKYAGEAGAKVIALCRQRVTDDDGRATLDRVSTALDERHELVHSLWVHGPDGAFAWRPRSEKHRADASNPYDGRDWTEERVAHRITDTVGLIRALDRMRQDAGSA
ncbi:MAG: hypothetical protein QOJ11_2807 [Frankiales bacterium]|jgi:hypothetical protein|nr:hypothetical protein [Frankiales bacterium]